MRDPGILHALLNIKSFDELLGHPILGSSWEGFVIENILSVVPEGVSAYFYRTSAGAEIDLVLDFGDSHWAIEIKSSTAPKLSRGFHNACEDIKPTGKWVVYTGSEKYGIQPDITVLPLGLMMEELRSLR